VDETEAADKPLFGLEMMEERQAARTAPQWLKQRRKRMQEA
jgi:hypothetical protein